MRLQWRVSTGGWVRVGLVGLVAVAALGCGGGGGNGGGAGEGGGAAGGAAGAAARGGSAGAGATGGVAGAGALAGASGSGPGGATAGAAGHVQQATGGIGGGAGAHGTGGTGGAVPTPTSVQDLCQLFCGRLATCDTARDQQTCLFTCRDSNSAVFPNLRPELVAGIASCIQQDDCATIDKDTALGTCLTQAAATLAPSPAGTSFCSALQTADAQCGVTMNQTDCLNSIKVYSEATIAQAMACTSKSCSLVYSCSSATVGQASGSWSLGGGLKPGQKCSGTAQPCSYFYTQSSCETLGCTYSSTCTGTPYCTYSYASASCMAISGCSWSTSTATCTGAPTVTCASLGTTSATCQQNVGCFLNTACTGTTPACSTLSVSTCAAHGGCSVVDAL